MTGISWTSKGQSVRDGDFIVRMWSLMSVREEIIVLIFLYVDSIWCTIIAK